MKKKLAIVGGGTAGLFLASFLDTEKYEVNIFEKKSSIGRKFLVAGDGGFNLTHSEDLPAFISRYTPTTFLKPALTHFSNVDMRQWLSKLGIQTFVGSSGRVFPKKGIKPIKVLKAIESNLKQKGVKIFFNKTLTKFVDKNSLRFNSSEEIKAEVIVFALGGASWKVTGSDGLWLATFEEKGVATLPFESSNCAYKIDWNQKFIKDHEGKPLKNIAVSSLNKSQKGELVLTASGIEGNAIYALSPQIRSQLKHSGIATIYIDFKPTLDESTLIKKITSSSSKITSVLKQKVNLSSQAIALLKDHTTKEDFFDPIALAKYIKNMPLQIQATAPLDEAISTSGGISIEAVSNTYELHGLKNTYCIGEMLDWDAPTGGYLIQACASMGVYLAQHLNQL